LSLNTGIFPDDWKIARVTPIYKSDNKTDCGNYRPISIISNVAQVFEKVIYSQLITFLNENKVIAENHSIETTLLHSIINYLDNMNKGLINGVVFIYLKKASIRLITLYSQGWVDYKFFVVRYNYSYFENM
jgi:hypothetical protein